MAVATSREILEHAAGVVERGWTQGEFARDAEGVGVAPESDEAASFCLVGACRRAFFELGIDPELFTTLFDRMRERITAQIGTPSISMWNDALPHTGEEVAQALREAAAS